MIFSKIIYLINVYLFFPKIGSKVDNKLYEKRMNKLLKVFMNVVIQARINRLTSSITIINPELDLGRDQSTPPPI